MDLRPFGHSGWESYTLQWCVAAAAMQSVAHSAEQRRVSDVD